MSSCSRVDVVENNSIANTFRAWKEKVGNQRTEFFLQLQNFQWILAVVGVMADQPNMEFVIDPAFYWSYKQYVTSLGRGEWKKKRDVEAWLKVQISLKPLQNRMLTAESEHPYQVIMDAGDFSALIDSEDATASLEFPSGYTDAYSLPSRTQIVLKHGARNLDVNIEHGGFTQGWDFFVTEHGIDYGYVVKFHFRGCSTYMTEIFDSKRGKKVYLWSNYHEWIKRAYCYFHIFLDNGELLPILQ